MMKKNEYVTANAEFISYLGKVIKGVEKVDHTYLDGAMLFGTLEDACSNYLFPMSSNEARSLKIKEKLDHKRRFKGLCENENKLSIIRNDLNQSRESGDQDKYFYSIKRALYWGATGKIQLNENTKRQGTYSANKEWIEKNILGETNLIEYFEKACNILSSTEPDIEKFSKDGPYRMNAGFTKLYSLLTDNYIIYDGRVGAALGYLVSKYCINKPKRFTNHLKFAWGPAESAKSAKTKSRAPYRNPSIKKIGLVFPKLSNSKGADWAKWNIYANWLLEASMDKVGWRFNGVDGQQALRRVEAALFMIGYDFPEREPEDVRSKGTNKKNVIEDGAMLSVVKECQRVRKDRGFSKKKAASYALGILPGLSRQQAIFVFIEGCGLTKSGASTYYYKLKKD